MKKLLALSLIGSSLIVGSKPVTSNELIQHVNHGGSTSIIGIQSVNALTGATTTLATFDNGEEIGYPQGIYFTNEFQGKYYVKASDNNGSFWFEYDNNTETITKKANLAISGQLGMSQFPYGIKSVVSKNDDGTIQIGSDENDVDVTAEGLTIDGEPLITKKANGELHIGKNSWITKEENGRQKVYAKDANGNPIPIDYTNGTKLLINGRDVEQSINNIGALSAALTGLPTVPTDTTLACGLGTGTHGGYFAFSGGCASKVNDKLSINYAASMTMPGQDYAGDFEDKFSARAGFVWKLGKATKPILISMKETNELKKEISELRENNNQIISQNKNLQLENQSIISQNKSLLIRLERLEKIALEESKSKDLATMKLP